LKNKEKKIKENIEDGKHENLFEKRFSNFPKTIGFGPQ